MVVPAVALLVAPIVAAMPQLSAAAEQTAALEPLIARIDEGSAFAVLHFGKRDHGLLFDPTSFGNRVLAERDGRELASFVDYPIAPVVIAPGFAGLHRPAHRGEVGFAAALHRPHAPRVVLVHVHELDLASPVVRAFEPEAGLIDASGEWMLFRSRLPRLPVTAPDAPADVPAETIQDRVTRLLRRSTPP